MKRISNNLPKDWTVKKLGEIFDFVQTLSLSREQLTYENTDNSIKYVHYGDIHSVYENQILDLDSDEKTPFIKNEIILSKNISYLQDGDLIIADASEDYEGVGECIEIKNVKNQKIVGGLHTIAVRDSTQETVEGFRAYLFKNQAVRMTLKQNATGTSVYGISKNTLSKLDLYLPPLPEQQKIAQILSTWNESIQTTQSLIKKLEIQKKGLMQRLLSSEGKNWKTYQIAELIKPVRRPVKWDDNELYHLISVRRRSGGAFFRESLMGSQILTKGLFTAKKGDFLMSKMQITHGATGLVNESLDNMKISGSYIAVVAKNTDWLNINFMNWYSRQKSFYHLCYTSSYGVHIEKMTFDFDTFLKREMTVPPIEEQTAIVKILDTAEAELNETKAYLETLKQQKTGLMQQLLTGRIIVKTK